MLFIPQISLGIPFSRDIMGDRRREYSPSLRTSPVRSHSPYCEATGPIVDEGFVASRIRELQKVYHRTWTPTQSHSPMSPCPIYPKLQKYEISSQLEPHEPPVRFSARKGPNQMSSGTARSWRRNYVGARYLSNSESFEAWNRSADDIRSTKSVAPRSRKLARKGPNASSGDLNDSIEGESQKHTSTSAAVLSSTPLTGGDLKEQDSQTSSRRVLKSDQGSDEYNMGMLKSGIDKVLSHATDSSEKESNDYKGTSPAYYTPKYNLQPTQPTRFSGTPQELATPTTPSATQFPASSALGIMGQIHSKAKDVPSSISERDRLKKTETQLKTEHHGTSGPAFKEFDDQDSIKQIDSISSQSIHQTWSPPTGRRKMRQQSLPDRPGALNRYPSVASTQAPSFVSSAPSSQLWKKWRAWKLVLVDKHPSTRNSSDRRNVSSPLPTNDIMNLPGEAPQDNLENNIASPVAQPSKDLTSSNRATEGHHAGAADEREARVFVKEVPHTECNQPSRNAKEALESGKILANTTMETPTPTSVGCQGSEWVATFPLDESVQDANGTSLFRIGRDDLGESTDSTDATRGRTIKKIQIVISFDEVADLVIEAQLKGKQAAQ